MNNNTENNNVPQFIPGSKPKPKLPSYKGVWFIIILIIVALIGAAFVNWSIKETAKEKERILINAEKVKELISVNAEKEKERLLMNAEKLLADKVKVPNPYFKTKVQVENEFKRVGLKVEFVVSNFDKKAEVQNRFLRKDECDQLGDESGAEYFGVHEVGAENAGYYAEKGSTITVGYSDHHYDGRKKAENEETSTSKPEETEKTKETPTPEPTVKPTPKPSETALEADFDGGFHFKILDWGIAEDSDGFPALIINFEFTNNDNYAINFYDAFSWKVLQDGINLNFVADDIGLVSAVIQPGYTVKHTKLILTLTSEEPVQFALFDKNNFTEPKIFKIFDLDNLPISYDDSDVEYPAFTPNDVSDKAINAIETYNDYLDMCQLIIDDYLTNYEAAIKDTILYDEGTFEEMKKSYGDAFEQQKGMYGSMGEMKIVGKSSLVNYLITYRDSLKDITDNVAKSLN